MEVHLNEVNTRGEKGSADIIAFPSHDGPEFQSIANSGCGKCVIAYYACAAGQVFSSLTEILIARTLPGNSTVRLKVFEKGRPPSIFINQTHCVAGDIHREAISTLGVMVGSYLQIVTPIYAKGEQEAEREADRSIKRIEEYVALLALFNGPIVALERHFLAVFDIMHNEYDLISNEIRHFDRHEEQSKLNGMIVDALVGVPDSELIFESRVLEMLSRAHHETDSTHRLLCYWLAIEMAIGDGDKRKFFAQEELQSVEADRILHRLRDLRGSYVHRGELINPTFKDELFLRLILILKFCRNASARERLKSLLGDIESGKINVEEVRFKAYRFLATATVNPNNA